MSRVPTDKRIDRNAFTSAEAVSRILSRFMGDTVNALTALTFRENHRAQWHEFQVVIPPIANPESGLVMAGCRLTTGDIATAAETIVNFDTVEWNTHAAITTGSSWKFTAPFTSRYLLTTAVTLTAALPSTEFQLNVFRNGVKYRRLFRFRMTGTTNADLTGNGAVVLDLTQNDYVDVRAFQNSGSTLSYDPDDETWIQITEQNTTIEEIVPVPATCWPYTFLYAYDKRPMGVLATEIRELTSNAYVGAQLVDWDMVVKDGRTAIQVRNIPGLTPGKAYKITLLVLVE